MANSFLFALAVSNGMGGYFHNNNYWGDRSLLKKLSKGELESWFKNLLY